jgi:nucleotide-binding universal stress UspA family protein
MTPAAGLRIRRIVLGVDGSDGAMAATRWCAAFARTLGAEVIAVYALEPLPEIFLDLPPLGPRPWKDDLRAALHLWCAPLREAGVPHREELVEDDAAPALVHVAEKEEADLIVVGAHGHGSVADRLLGSVTYKLAHNASRPVVVVPTAAAAQISSSEPESR